jgi:hypothetical protein
MFTCRSGVGVAYLYSLVATFMPDLFPMEIRHGVLRSMRSRRGDNVWCCWPVLELRREQTGGAIAPVGLAPKSAGE